MEPLSELLGVTHTRALEFFALGLRDVSDPSVDRLELLYNASVLAHFAQVSTHATTELPTPAHLGAVLDHFVLDTTLHHDARMMETAGAQCLLLTGFFERQMRQRHSIAWYAELGAGFFGRAAALEHSRQRSRLLSSIGRGFEAWRLRHRHLSRELRNRAYVLGPWGRTSG